MAECRRAAAQQAGVTLAQVLADLHRFANGTEADPASRLGAYRLLLDHLAKITPPASVTLPVPDVAHEPEFARRALAVVDGLLAGRLAMPQALDMLQAIHRGVEVAHGATVAADLRGPEGKVGPKARMPPSRRPLLAMLRPCARSGSRRPRRRRQPDGGEHMPMNMPVTEEAEAEADDDPRLRELIDRVGDDDVPEDERMRALDEAAAILSGRDPLQFEYPPGWTRVQRWLSAWLCTFDLRRDGKISARRCATTIRELEHEARVEMDDAERQVISRHFEPFAKMLPLLRAAIERRKIEDAGGRLN